MRSNQLSYPPAGHIIPAGNVIPTPRCRKTAPRYDEEQIIPRERNLFSVIPRGRKPPRNRLGVGRLKYNRCMTGSLGIRWLGTAGIELQSRGERLLVDPYLSRFPLHCALIGRHSSRRDVVLRHLHPAPTVLVTHAHFDHLLDVPTVCGEFGSTAYGSPNTGAILRAHGIPSAQVRCTAVGESLAAGPFDITVFPGRHGRVAGVLPFAGALPKRLNPPLRLSDYRMDSMFSFHIRTAEASILIWNDPGIKDIPAADVIFFCPLWGARSCADAAKAARASLIIPVHWDIFFSGLDRPLRPMLVPPGWRSMRFRRMDPRAFSAGVKRLVPGVSVRIPDPFELVTWRSTA
jgi:L-ascorbate metabolism protein UlaG (beta-lactamase superfamily)